MKPSSGEGFVRGFAVFQIALHHDIAAHHDFAKCFAISGHRLHGLRIFDVERFKREIAHALPRFFRRLFGGR